MPSDGKDIAGVIEGAANAAKNIVEMVANNDDHKDKSAYKIATMVKDSGILEKVGKYVGKYAGALALLEPAVNLYETFAAAHSVGQLYQTALFNIIEARIPRF